MTTETKKKIRKGQIDYKPVEQAIAVRMLVLTDPLLGGGTIECVLSSVGIDPQSKEGERLRRGYRRGVERGHAGIYHVDEMCCAVLKKHPAELYGEEWFTA